jgi:hypothetical protein
MFNKEFSKLCTPARLYFVIAIISTVVALFSKVSLLAVFIKLLFGFIWTYILGWLCKKGYESLSWFLVLCFLIAWFLDSCLLVFISD